MCCTMNLHLHLDLERKHQNMLQCALIVFTHGWMEGDGQREREEESYVNYALPTSC